jgi:predicted AlkP superfamily pyrophosphatase or phosphodiesterase
VAQPTYTVTNVKAILTGSNPFEYGKIYEMLYERRIAMDNVASQLISNGNQTLMMGDNVWNKTFEFTSTDYSCDRTFDIYQRKLTC